MSEPAVDLVGLERFQRTAAAAVRDLEDMADTHDAAVEVLERAAAAAAPRRTGELASSFGTRVTATTGELFNTARHAVPVQFGTRHMAARPFLPVDVARDVTPIFVDAVDAAVSSIKGR